MSGCVSLKGEGTVCLGVCHSRVKGPCVWVRVTRVGAVYLGAYHSGVRGRVSGCVSLRGEGTVCLGACHSGEGMVYLGACHSVVKGPCVWVYVTQG